MSEAETSSTRRKPTKPKAVLPVVRTTSKTLERPLGLVIDIIYLLWIIVLKCTMISAGVPGVPRRDQARPPP